MIYLILHGYITFIKNVIQMCGGGGVVFVRKNKKIKRINES